MQMMNLMQLSTHFKFLNIEERDSDVEYVMFTQRGKSNVDDPVTQGKAG